MDTDAVEQALPAIQQLKGCVHEGGEEEEEEEEKGETEKEQNEPAGTK